MTIVHAWRNRVPAGDALAQLVKVVNHYRPCEIVLDDDNGWKLLKPTIGRTFREHGVSPPYFNALTLHGVRSAKGESKQLRASPLPAAASRGEVRILRRHWTSDLVDELVRFPGGSYDDWLDCCSLLARRLALHVATPPEKLMREYSLPDGRKVLLPIFPGSGNPDAWMTELRPGGRYF